MILISFMFGHCPYIETGIIALVFSVIADSKRVSSMLNVSYLISTKTGLAPSKAITSAVISRYQNKIVYILNIHWLFTCKMSMFTGKRNYGSEEIVIIHRYTLCQQFFHKYKGWLFAAVIHIGLVNESGINDKKPLCYQDQNQEPKLLTEQIEGTKEGQHRQGKWLKLWKIFYSIN